MRSIAILALCVLICAVASIAAPRSFEDLFPVHDRSDVPFGAGMRKFFMFGEGFVQMNHGAFGSTPREVITAQRGFVDEMESMTDNWFRGGYFDILSSVRPAIAKYIGANETDVVFIENASSAVNSVLRSLADSTSLKNHDALVLSTVYPMVTNTLGWLQSRDNINTIQLNLTFPLLDTSVIVKAVENMLASPAGRNIRICIFDHISSYPSMIMPLKQLAAVCRAAGALTLVDGAHALGQIAVDLSQLGVDFWLGNAHKWLYSPKGSAVLWARKDLQPLLAPTVISSEWENGFQTQYLYTGTRDYTAFCAIGAALAFRQSLGEARILSYIHELAVWGNHYLAHTWGTEALTSDALTAGMMSVRLPTSDAGKAYAMRLRLVQEENIEIAVSQVQDIVWARISAQIFLEQADIERMAVAVLRLLK